jgi:S1-C subfamily serine protease
VPWQKYRQTQSSSSGFVVDDRLLLCNAHGIVYASSVRVRKHGDSKKYTAKVLHAGHDCDLALLTVEDDAFWKDMQPLELGGVPELQDSVTVIGFPTGGDQLSVSKGVVSRVDVTSYSHGSHDLLAIQIDAAINAGNSGGPAIQGKQVIGVAFQSLESAENIGYIIPVPIVKHFLEDIKRHGSYAGFPDLAVRTADVQNPSFKQFLQLPDETQHGIVVTRTFPFTHASKVLKPMDVIVKFNGVTVSDDQTIELRHSKLGKSVVVVVVVVVVCMFSSLVSQQITLYVALPPPPHSRN